MFYRRRILLSLLELMEGELEKIRLQKLLFLSMINKPKPEYEFVPYHYGCFSFSAQADLRAMVKHVQLVESDKIYQISSGTPAQLKSLLPKDREILNDIVAKYGNLSANGLMKHTYTSYPYFAINSKVVSSVLSHDQVSAVEKAIPSVSTEALYTIGYEGRSLEGYLNTLVENDIRILVDVRNHPQSMKFGFSKNRLEACCKGLGITYVHIPDLGIRSELRKKLNSQSDYNDLFASYKKVQLPQTLKAQQKVIDLIKQYKRVALTCFEADICQCHRKPLAESISAFPGFNYDVKHL